MLGNKKIFTSYFKDVVLELRIEIIESLLRQMEEYGFDKIRVLHIILTIIPLNNNLLNKYKVDSSYRKKIRDFIDSNFSSKTIIPVTVNPSFLEGELPTKKSLMVLL